MTDTFSYFAYGMHIRSEYRLPELVEVTSGQPDLVIRRRAIHRTMPEGQWRFVEFGEDVQFLAFLGIGKYLLHSNGTIDVDLNPEFDEGLIGFSLLGPVMAVVLHRRGLFTLHGSAADIGGKGVIFLGDKGAGKSTTIGATAAAGYQILTDDVVAIADPSAPKLVPAFPMIKLTDSALETFGRDRFELIPTSIAGFDKQRARLKLEFPTQPISPHVAFVLKRGDRAEIEQLSTIESYQALMRYSYATRFGDKLIHGGEAVKHMEHCASLTRSVTVARLVVPHGLDRISEATSLVEQMVL